MLNCTYYKLLKGSINRETGKIVGKKSVVKQQIVQRREPERQCAEAHG